jgi:biopolymer transport protein TolR
MLKALQFKNLKPQSAQRSSDAKYAKTLAPNESCASASAWNREGAESVQSLLDTRAEGSNDMAISMAGGGPSKPEINATPLIDVLLVLIIVFMVVVSMSKEKILKAQIPQPAANSARQAEPERTIVVQIVAARDPEQTPELKINQQDVSWDNLSDQLQRVFATRAGKVAFVRGDDAVDFQYVADVIDIAGHAGGNGLGCSAIAACE